MAAREPGADRLVEKLERTLGLIVLLHSKVADLLLMLDDGDRAASQSLELLAQSKELLKEPK